MRGLFRRVLLRRSSVSDPLQAIVGGIRQLVGVLAARGSAQADTRSFRKMLRFL
jgi:hypothetical protein